METETLVDKVRNLTSQIFSSQVWTLHQRMKNSACKHIATSVSEVGTTARNPKSCKKRLRDCKKIIMNKIAARVKTLKSWEKKVAEFFGLAVAEVAHRTSAQAIAPKKAKDKTKRRGPAVPPQGRGQKRRLDVGEEEEEQAQEQQTNPQTAQEQQTSPQPDSQPSTENQLSDVECILEEMRRNEEEKKKDHSWLEFWQQKMTNQMAAIAKEQKRIQQAQQMQHSCLVGMSDILKKNV